MLIHLSLWARLRQTRPPTGLKRNGRRTALCGFLLLLCAAGFAILLDLRLGNVLVLRTNHSEDRRSRVLASGNRAELLRSLPAGLPAQVQASGQHLGWPAGRAFSAERVLDGHARAIQRLTFHQGTELI